MESNERVMDSFDEALRAEAMMSASDIKRLNEEDDDFRKVNHDECIYRFWVLLLEAAVDSPRDILTTFTNSPNITQTEKHRLTAFAEAITKESATLSKLAKVALVVAKKLEKEHLAHVERVSQMLSKEDLAVATLCYPVTPWNMEKYSWRLLYHMGIDSIVDLSEVTARLSRDYPWIQRVDKRMNIVPLVMLDYNWTYAWDIALSNLFHIPVPSTNQEREELYHKYQNFKKSHAGALAEVYFGHYGGLDGLSREEVGYIAEELESAGHESMLNEVDQYSKRLKETVVFEELPVDGSYLLKGLNQACQKLVREKSIYSRRGYRPRQYVIGEVGFDPREALLADLVEEAKEPGKTLRKLAEREGIPVKDLYEFQRRRKYRQKKSL